MPALAAPLPRYAGKVSGTKILTKIKSRESVSCAPHTFPSAAFPLKVPPKVTQEKTAFRALLGTSSGSITK